MPVRSPSPSSHRSTAHALRGGDRRRAGPPRHGAPRVGGTGRRRPRTSGSRRVQAAPSPSPAVSEYIHDAETTHDYLLLEGGDDDTQWTRTALTVADRIVVVMSADPDRRRGAARRSVCSPPAPRRSQVERWLGVLHPPAAERPRARRHRRSTRRSIGWCTSRAGSHARPPPSRPAGVGKRHRPRARRWRGTRLRPPRRVAGAASSSASTSTSSAGRASGHHSAPGWRCGSRPTTSSRSPSELFHGLLDYTVPVVSLVKGARITRNITAQYGDLDVRDLWLPFFCVSTNLTRSRVEVHDRAAAGHGDSGQRGDPGHPSPCAGRAAICWSTGACSTTCRAT